MNNGSGDVAAVIPVYGELGSALDEITRRIQESLGVDLLEVILVDDGSKNQNWNEILRLSQNDPKVRGLRLGRNYGQHSALWAGIKSTSAAYVVTLDADLQHPPEEIPQLLAYLERNKLDVLYGVPEDPKHSRWRRFSSSLLRTLIRSLSGTRSRTSAFRVIRTSITKPLDTQMGSGFSLDAALSWATSQVGSLSVRHHQRQAGDSSYGFFQLFRLAMNIIVAYSIVPLRIVTFLGLSIGLLGFGLLIFVLISFLTGDNSEPGFTFVASAICLLSGAQLLGMGVIGEYVGRVHLKSIGRPTFVVVESTQETGAINPKVEHECD